MSNSLERVEVVEVQVAEAEGACPIAKLGDTDLAAIFKYLPPVDRLLVSEVCLRWRDVCRLSWLEITHLDLGRSIPSRFIGAMLRHCSNLTSVSASGRQLFLDDLTVISLDRLASLKLYDCRIVYKHPQSDLTEIPFLFAPVWPDLELDRDSDAADLLQIPSLFSSVGPDLGREMILHDSHVTDRQSEWANTKRHAMVASKLLPAALKAMQLSGLRQEEVYFYCQRLGSDESTFENLQCLILQSDYFLLDTASGGALAAALNSLGRLRELFIGLTNGGKASPLPLGNVELPMLEVLFIDVGNVSVIDLGRLYSNHRKLRVLVLPGVGNSPGEDLVTFPVRNLFPDGPGSDPLPFLDVFLGKWATRRFDFLDWRIRGASKIHALNLPMPQALVLDELKPIFEGVWLAEKILECVARGVELWLYEKDVADVAGDASGVFMPGTKHIARVLYKRILRLHRGLPPDLIAVGNNYVRDEFRRHKAAKEPEAWTFLHEWMKYYATLGEQLTAKGIARNVPLGEHLPPEGIEALRDEQILQLYELKKETEKPLT